MSAAPDAVPPSASGACTDCAAGNRHAFLVHLIPEEGPAWEKLVQAIGPRDAGNIAFEELRDVDFFDVSVGAVRHAPAEEEVNDPIDEWKAYRDAGLSDTELRYLDGDR